MEEASVAGESPDRSKQRESSAEPTSGSAGSVPEARDPRLAVSREKDSSGGGTDTATKVLTVRPETPAEPEEPADTDNSADSAEDTALRAAVSAWVREPRTNTTAKPSGKTEAATAGAGNEAEQTSDAEAEAGAETSSGASTEADTGAGTGAKSEADIDTKSDADADAKDGAKSDAPAKERTGAKSKAGATADAGTEDEADAKAGADTEGTADADAKDETDAESKTGDKADADTEGKAGADAKTGASAKAGAGSEADVESKANAHAKDKTDAESKTDDKADAGTQDEADADAEGKADADAKGDADAQGKAGAGAKAGAGSEGDAGDGAAEAEDEDGSADADGGEGPQGPPAGGAGGKTGADGEAEARVDQPTAVFKAVQPKKPAVDQPTTMLKLGGKPKPPESESERTSKFVALKDDMRPAGKAPAPDATTPVPQVGPERTTQQPLPPKPPLDLLAELTNTPPPPETPVRTIVRRVKIWTPLVLLLAIILAVVQAVRPLPAPALALTAEGTYTFDGRTNLPWPGEGQGWIDGDGIGTMGSFGKQTPVAIGSVAKTMTAYIILRDHPLKPGEEGPKIKIDTTAEKEGGYNKAGESTLDTVQAGQYLTEKQALSAVLIPSANNIARLLARWDAGSEAAFVKKMNATARELGMTRTTYTDPSGLKETTVSTAEDQVKLGRAFVKVPALVAISSAASWTDPSGKFWPNYNELPYRIGAIGIKTGSTTKAGGNLLFASRKKVDGKTVTLVGAILGQHKKEILKTVNTVSQTALLAAQSALTSSKILKKGDVVGYVDDGLGGHTPIVVTEDVTAAGWPGLKVDLSFSSGTVPHTAKAGTKVGTLTVGDGSSGAVKVPVALQKDLAEPGLGAKLTHLG
ncbi:D-alanyl-D-alanine carboxypeptidase [Streptomyces sp. NPDC046727]|uniref:D-alanyl-D-alanine carboxypeptidase n=1 Tax=Streptomyces sp. NPDC046727 TaxID=3155373 RepID=UPI0033C68023